MFGRKKDEAAAPQAMPATIEPTDRSRDPQSKKGAPTPSRKVQEDARKRPLVPNDRAAAKVAARDARREDQARQRRAMDTGDEKYLPARDKGPQKRYVRDHVDARFSLGEYVMFVALGIVVISMVVPNVNVQIYVFAVFWVMVAAVALDAWLMTRKLKRKINEKFGIVDRGVVWYATMRSLQFRRLRLPKPQVKRGQYPD